MVCLFRDCWGKTSISLFSTPAVRALLVLHVLGPHEPPLPPRSPHCVPVSLSCMRTRALS